MNATESGSMGMAQPHNTVVGTRFTTQAPSLVTERANATPLFAVYRELVNCVAVWGGGRLRSDAGPTAATAAQQRRSSAPTTPSDGDSRRHVLVDEALGNASSNTNETQTTQTRDGPRRRDAVAMTSVVRGNDGVSVAAPTPSWIEAEMEAFFDVALARAIQERETNLVNVMHECFQQQLGEQHRALDTQRQLTTSLSARVQSYEKEMTHMQSKIDRRVAENNALRKDFYKQLLMLRELVNKHKSDPRTLRALDEVITTITLGKEKAAAFAAEAANSNHGKRSADTRDQDGLRGDGSGVSQSNSLTVRREKEKWEERAREAMMECQQLQEQVLLLRQQIDEGGSEGSHWFSSAQFGLGERQRIIDAVYKGRCSWENVGDAVVELLNNDMIWEAVEDSAYREKTRVSRGFEAMLLRAEVSSEAVDDLDLDPDVDGVGGSSRRTLNRRRSAFSQGGRLVLCRSCNGCGYIDATAMQNGDDLPEENDSYLRKTLAQVLELKTALEKANQQTVQAEDALRKVVMEGSSIKERLERIEFIKAHGVDSGLQTGLDAEEEIDIDEIMSTYSSGESSGSGAMGSSRLARRNDGRWKQYEHLIVELKNSVTERDTGLAELRSTLSNFQSKLVAVQKDSQQEQVRHQQEVQTLKASLALAMKSRNDAIEEKQAAMKVMLKKMNTKSSKLSAALFSAKKVTESDASSDDDTQSQKSNNSSDNTDDVAKDECDDEADEVKRSELIARRYSDAISRVQQEYDEQQRALKQTEVQLTEETDKRKRTNSIMLGNIAVTMTSHPRDLFKALSTAHNELTNLRRSSQRSSALQTDRLLTLTTHLAHMSEELCMVRKRTNTEIEYWKLECEKLHNTNKMGSAIALHAPSGATGLPSHYRKKIVRKILSEQEVLQRQRARYSRSFSPPDSSALSTGASSFESYNPEVAENDGWAGYSTYVDDNGHVVHFVEVEIDDDPQSSQEMSLNPSAVPTTTNAMIANTTSTGYSGPHASNQSERRSELTIQIPQPMPLDTEDSPNQQETRLTTVARPTHSAAIDRDPQVIAQLRDLLNHISTTRQALALTNWRILLSHLRAQREERRLDYISHQFKQAVAAGKLGSSQSLPTSVRCTIQKLVQTRELALDTAIHDRDSLRRNVRRAQAHLIHGVSSILTTLSRKANGRVQVPEAPYIIHTDPQRSPPRNPPSPVYRGRPIYPTTPINLSEIPDTQQVPTPSFPFNPADGGGENVFYQKTPPVSASSSPAKSFVSSTLAVNNQLPSLFENDNRFPQRATTFVPAGDSEEKSLTHSTSTILHPSRSPASSPSKSSILLDARRRPTRSADLQWTKSIVYLNARLDHNRRQLA
ncbi:hypothetical protein Poli38472_002513 [Pythium oligandrum]|uniref:Uncharacterized protein n=1 Tax=Pythium oligandrum TaxID=41045 RepID=A0A8K1FL81_PYTOL|nr:hypothetical protein Poli38472_002513 [Pythium oligandrum]|eukprot:TMW63572.1 hypothetical protein Poli38472_002513 [Pythium oligandrum]